MMAATAHEVAVSTLAGADSQGRGRGMEERKRVVILFLQLTKSCLVSDEML